MEVVKVIFIVGLVLTLGLCTFGGFKPAAGGDGIDDYEQCILDNMRATARKFANDTSGRVYYTITEEEVVAMARRNAELACAGK